MERVEYERMHAVEDRMWWYRGLRRLVAQVLDGALADSTAAGPLLDAGCGTGGMLRALGPARAGHPTFGLEYDAIAAGLAASKAGCPVVSGSVNEMPIGDGTLAGYLSLDVLCHGGVDPGRALEEAHRCLRPGAIAVFNLPAYGWLLSAHDRRVHNVRRFAGAEVRRLLDRHGFRVLRSSYWNTLLFPVMLLHRLVERDDAASDVRDFPVWLDRLFSAALAVERAVIGLGISLPFGGSLIVVAARNG
ncbi:MAG: class I SAM-dependent methyltransferase [Reyranella sp.]|uniref:class I SAM-dependent methyltransferase n=1 Tax=Reyranella sp. TaxID=1929291 RepID=UPI003D12502C